MVTTHGFKNLWQGGNFEFLNNLGNLAHTNILLHIAFQIHSQFPCSFEFTEKFLVTLGEHAYFSNFGTFLCDSEYERNLLGVKEKTVSLWSFLNRPEILSKYLNCLYEPNSLVIWPSVAPISLVSINIL